MTDSDTPLFNQERTRILIGDQGVQQLSQQHVLIVGLGGVGGYAAENIVRSGVGRMTVIDHDQVNASNLNRQIIATQQTIGQDKASVLAHRLFSIHPNLQLEASTLFLQYSNIDALLERLQPDYVLDCIDSLSCKSELVSRCQLKGIPVISALGAGGRMDATLVKVTTLSLTSVCPLAKVLRNRLRKLGASLDYPVIFSSEVPQKGSQHQAVEVDSLLGARSVNGTIAYLPAIFGVLMAGHVIRQLLNESLQT